MIKQKNEIVREIKDFINAKFGEIGSRWGKDAEITLRTFMQEVLTKEFNAKVEKWTYRGIIKEIDPIRDRYEVDICVISDGRVLLIEYKSRAEYEDVVGFIKNCMGYERITGKKASRKILVCVSAEEEAKIFVQNNNIEFFYRTF